MMIFFKSGITPIESDEDDDVESSFCFVPVVAAERAVLISGIP
jgi:hypothetical protein